MASRKPKPISAALEVVTPDIQSRVLGRTDPGSWDPQLRIDQGLGEIEAEGPLNAPAVWQGGTQIGAGGVTRMLVPLENDFKDRSGADADFLIATDLATASVRLVHEHPVALAPVKRFSVIYLWRRTGGTAKGQPVRHGITKAAGALRFLTRASFIVWLAADRLVDAPSTLVDRLLFRTLKYIDVDEQGRARVRAPEVVLFPDEIEAFGAWDLPMQNIQRLMAQLPLDLTAETEPTDERVFTDPPEDEPVYSDQPADLTPDQLEAIGDLFDDDAIPTPATTVHDSPVPVIDDPDDDLAIPDATYGGSYPADDDGTH